MYVKVEEGREVEGGTGGDGRRGRRSGVVGMGGVGEGGWKVEGGGRRDWWGRVRARCGSGDGQVEVGREVEVYVRACGRSTSGER